MTLVQRKFVTTFSERETEKFFLNEMCIPSGPDWNESLDIARHLQQISEVILIDSNEEEDTYGNKGVDTDWI